MEHLPADQHEFAEAYAAFKGAFDTPQMRRLIDNEYAADARQRLAQFAEHFLPQSK